MRYLVHPNGRQEEDRVIRTRDGREAVVGETLPRPEVDHLEPAAGYYLGRLINDPRVTEGGVHVPETARDSAPDFVRFRILKVGPKKAEKPRYEKGQIVITSKNAGMVLALENFKPLVAFFDENAIIGQVEYGELLQ